MFFKKIMVWMILISILITISSKNWFIWWLMMEINMMTFIPLMNYKNLQNCNSMITYFIIQSFSSSIFFFSFIMQNINEIYLFNMMINLAISIKLALVPFHYWLPMISEGLDNYPLFLILTLQKIIPLFILSFTKNEMIILLGLLSSFMGSVMAFNFKLIKKILIFSSIAHLGWITILIVMNSNFWLFYLIIYSLIIFKLVDFLIKKSTNLAEISKSFNMNENITMFMTMMSLGGIPPFLGFFMKLIAIIIILEYSKMVMLILIMSSLINIFFYMRIIYLSFFLKMIFLKNFKTKNWMKSLFININTFMLLLLMNLMMQ
uniref:NADH dehydrogenase subunit 2 n=1 Tax=Amblyomma papuanum TaxID=3065601 RepID=UPI0030FEB195